METYRVLFVEPKIETITKKRKLYNRDGREAGTEDVVTKYQTVHLTDGTRYEGRLTDYLWYAPPNSVDVGDLVSAFDQNGHLCDAMVVRGRNAIAVPASPVAPPPMQPLPETSTEQTPAWLGSVMNGCSMSGEDLKQFAAFCLALAQKHKNLADAFRKYVAEHP